MADYPETVRALRRRDKVLIGGLAALGRLMRMNTRVRERGDSA